MTCISNIKALEQLRVLLAHLIAYFLTNAPDLMTRSVKGKSDIKNKTNMHRHLPITKPDMLAPGCDGE